MIGESSQRGTNGTWSFTAQCPTRTLLIKGALDEDDQKYVEVYDPEDGTSDVEKTIRSCSVQLNVVRCLLAAPRDKDWRRSSVFHTYIKHNDKRCKVMIDEGSCINIIAKSAVKNLKVELILDHTTLLRLTNYSI